MTELDEILEFLVEQVDGALAAAVAGMDGLLVEQYPQHANLGPFAAELTAVLGSSSAAMSDHLGAGETRELMVAAESRLAYIRVLSADLFCLIVLGADGNLGKARLYGEQAAKRLVAVLA
ncbi:MAG: roadblock/LC7 domain-containing protein [Trueperaceae bacterium]